MSATTAEDPFRGLIESLRPFYGVISTESPEFLYRYPCEICRRRCNSSKEMELHMQYHRRENECSVCGKTFSSFEIFSAHVRKHYVDATKLLKEVLWSRITPPPPVWRRRPDLSALSIKWGMAPPYSPRPLYNYVRSCSAQFSKSKQV
eukprot:sb/3473699/